MDNCKKEFSYAAARKGPNRMVAKILAGYTRMGWQCWGGVERELVL
jgi:hypothetical protein